MERSNTLYPFVYELDCSMYNGKYNKTKKEWIDKMKQYNYNIKCKNKIELSDKKQINND